MTDPMLTGNPAIVTIEGSLRIIDLYEKVFYSCISRLLVLWDFLLKTIGLIKKKTSKIKESRCQRLKTLRRSKCSGSEKKTRKRGSPCWTKAIFLTM